MAMTLSSPAFEHEGEIPARYTCDGEDLSPPLVIAGVPAGTKSLALIVDDPDAPDPKAPRMVWVHWVAYNLPPDLAELREGAGNGAPPAGASYGVNDWGRTDYGGPCPPIGRHRYFFKLYALDKRIDAASPLSKAELLARMQGHVLDEAVLIGTYARRR